MEMTSKMDQRSQWRKWETGPLKTNAPSRGRRQVWYGGVPKASEK